MVDDVCMYICEDRHISFQSAFKKNNIVPIDFSNGLQLLCEMIYLKSVLVSTCTSGELIDLV